MRRKGIILTGSILMSCAMSIPPAYGGSGRFLSLLLARGAIAAGVRSAHANTYAPKVYGTDVLTVSQLAGCIKVAAALDHEHDAIEAERNGFVAIKAKIEQSKAVVETARSVVDNHSKYSVDRFNEIVNRHNALVIDAKSKNAAFNSKVDSHNTRVDTYNATCEKKYYESDLAPARQLAGLLD